jgi:flagellar hook-associated protein 3 FlgL
MSSKNNHQIFVTELGNSNLLRKINVLSNEPGTNAPNNLTSEATAEKMTVFDVLIKVRDDLLNDNVEDLNGEDIGYIDSAIDNIMTRTGSVGAKVNRLESVENRLSTLKYNNETLLADAEGIDLTEVYTKLQEIQSVQTAALKVGAQIFNLSLMNYL